MSVAATIYNRMLLDKIYDPNRNTSCWAVQLQKMAYLHKRDPHYPTANGRLAGQYLCIWKI